jgi:hypothetical protein
MASAGSLSSASRLQRGVVSEAINGSRLLQMKTLTTSRRHQGTEYFSCMYDAVWTSLQFKKKKPKLISSSSIKPICVTGIEGFLASWIVHELLSRGYAVRGTVQNRNDDISGVLELSNSNNLTIVETSLLTPEACDIAVQGKLVN